MLEPITDEKLKEYGFNDSMIERLKTWTDYDCKVINNKGNFYASNATGLIYSGELGYDKCRDLDIDRFKTFDAMFQRAVEMKSIDLYTDPNLTTSHKRAIYQTDRSRYNYDFNAWLQKFKGWEYDNEPQYKEFLTKEVWIEYLAYKQNQKGEREKRHEAEKKSWQIKGKEPEPKEPEAGTPRREIIKDRISKYGFLSFLTDHKKLNADGITEIENLLCKNELPYCIALLNSLEYLEYFKREYCNGKAVQRDKLLAEVFDTTARRVRGNINVLNPNSNEDRTNYTSHQYTESIDKLIKGR